MKDDGRTPVNFIQMVDQELNFYSDVQTVYTDITNVTNIGSGNLTKFSVSNGAMSWTGRKLRIFPK